MFDQTFALADLAKVFFLSFLEIILSMDNAVVLALLTAPLPDRLRPKALYIGLISALITRALALLFLSVLIQYKAIQLLGAAYLFYICIRYFFKKKKEETHSGSAKNFWKAVLLIELFDLAFAVDSIVAGIAFISTRQAQDFFSKLWIVYVGGIIGLIAVRYAAHLFTSLLKRFSRLELYSHLMIGWMSVRLIYELFPHPSYFEPVFWTGLYVLFLLGLVMKNKKQHG